MKVLLALQYWEGDRKQGEATARLISDLEPQRNKDVDFMLACRFDSGHTKSLAEYIGRKYDVYLHRGRRREVGWPAGPNSLWFDTIAKVYEQSKAKKMPRYDFVLTFEPDCSPMRPGWVEALHGEWSAANVKAMGDVLAAPGEHMNGNACFSGDLDFLGHITNKIMGCSPHGGWDYFLASFFKRSRWFHSPSMVSEWSRHQPFSAEELESALKRGIVFHHGMKNGSLQKVVRERWLPRIPPLKT